MTSLLCFSELSTVLKIEIGQCMTFSLAVEYQNLEKVYLEKDIDLSHAEKTMQSE